jgi:hypothetical protein
MRRREWHFHRCGEIEQVRMEETEWQAEREREMEEVT